MINTKPSLIINSSLFTWSSLVFILALFPYIGFGVIRFSSEVQPWAALIAWVAVFAFLVNSRLQIRTFHIILLIFSLFFLIYIRNIIDLDLISFLRKSAAFILCFSLVIVAQYLQPSQVLSILKPAALVWLVFALFGFFQPEYYLDFIKPFVPNALGMFGDRGVTSLAPEATDFGFTMVYFWLLNKLASDASSAENNKSFSWLYFVIILNILLSGSASGIFAILVLFLLSSTSTWLGRWAILKIIFVIFFITIIILTVGHSYLDDTLGIRGLDLLILAFTSPLEMINTTFSYRIAHNLVGIFGFFDSNILGWGAGTFTTIGPEVYHDHNIGEILGVTGWYAENIPVTISVSPLAIFPVILFEYGVFGLFYLIYIFYKSATSNIKGRILIVALLFMTWFQSFPVAYPLFWILLGLTVNRNFRFK